MILAAHQPHFLPWLGYLNKLARSDCFVWLDTVQFRKNYFQNRTRVMDADGKERWLTLPVHASSTTPIRDVVIADSAWREQLEERMRQWYGRSPWFAECWPPIRCALQASSHGLSDAAYHTLRAVLDLLGLTRTRMVVAGELGVDADEPTERLIALCRALDASTYIAGRGGRGYMRAEAFAEAGISIVWQEFEPANAAYVRADGRQASGLSVLDPLFHIGPDATRSLVLDAWTPPS